MAMTYDTALVEAIGPDEGVALWVKRAVLVALGIAVLALAAKAKIMVPPSPVPITLGTLAVLTIGAAYGPRLGLVTILGYLLIGAAGYDIFASSSAENSGLAYMIGTSGGYLVGYVLAVMYLGWAARRGLDRSVEGMGGSMLIANVLIYVPGLIWLGYVIQNGIPALGADFSSLTWGAPLFDAVKHESASAQTLSWGFTPYVIGDLLKLAVAAVAVPVVWKLVGDARR